MPRININEVDNTLYSASNTRDNIVFVPGIATKGDTDKPILITNTRDFLDTFGDISPNNTRISGSSVMNSWEYAYNLINSGLSVLFRRIATTISKTAELDIYSKYTNGKKAEDAVKIGTVQARYPGTYGNRLSFTIDGTSFKIYVSSSGNTSARSLLETYSFGTDLSTETDSSKISNALNSIDSSNHTFNNVKITIDENNAKTLKSFPQTIDSNRNYVYQELANGTDDTYESIRTELEKDYEDSIYKELEDKYIYDIKFVTSGGVTGESIIDGTTSGHKEVSKSNIYKNMLNLVYKRQDCLALFDIPFGQGETNKNSLNTVFDHLSDSSALSYAAAYAPWGYMLLQSSKSYKWVAPSYIFLVTLSQSIKSGAFSWQVPAGVSRGLVSNISTTEFPVGESLLNTWQNDNPASINPIMNLRNYGYTIYGQRTLYSISKYNNSYTSALKEVGVRLVTIDIKKAIFNIAVGLTFEANTIHTWSEFKGQLEPYLDNIKANRGISSYQILMDSTTTTIDNINNNTVVGIVRITPTRAAENFDISFELNQDTISVTDDSDSFNVVISE